MGYMLQTFLEVTMPALSSLSFIIYAMQHWTASTIALTCVLLAASGLSGLNSLYRGVHRIHKHRQETFLKAKVLAMESNWSEHNHKKNEGHHCKYFDDEATDGIELRSGGGIRNESPSLFFGGSTKLFSMSNRMLGEQANTMERKEQVLEDLQEEQPQSREWHAFLSSTNLLEYEKALEESGVKMRQLLCLIPPKSANSNASQDILALLPVLQQVGIENVGDRMTIAQALRRLRH